MKQYWGLIPRYQEWGTSVGSFFCMHGWTFSDLFVAFFNSEEAMEFINNSSNFQSDNQIMIQCSSNPYSLLTKRSKTPATHQINCFSDGVSWTIVHRYHLFIVFIFYVRNWNILPTIVEPRCNPTISFLCLVECWFWSGESNDAYIHAHMSHV